MPINIGVAQESRELYYGVGSLMTDLDPQNAWDSASIDMIEQVCEGLFGYNLSDPEMQIIPVLAETHGSWNAEVTQYTVNLRQNVSFQDGELFDAQDVVWTFDRLASLFDKDISQLEEVYSPCAGKYPNTPLVINYTEYVSNHTIRFHLNYPYAPLEALLCFSGSSILSEESTPVDRLLNLDNETLIGTGPYQFANISSTTVTMDKFSTWQGEFPTNAYEVIHWVKFDNSDIKQIALLDGDLDWVDNVDPNFVMDMQSEPELYIDGPKARAVLNYIGINNGHINRTIRQAMSWAFNYTSVITDYYSGFAQRVLSPVPEGIRYHEPDLLYPFQNLTHARQILIDGGKAPGDAFDHLVDDAYWEDLTATDPIETYNFTYVTGGSYRGGIADITQTCMELIGIRIDHDPITWSEYLDLLMRRDSLIDLFQIGFGPDYNDPDVYLTFLYSNTSSGNFGNVNDSTLENLLDTARSTPDGETRADLYSEIQQYMVEDLIPCIYLAVGTYYGCWNKEVGGIQQNTMGKIQFSQMYLIIESLTNTTDTSTDDTSDPDDVNGGNTFLQGRWWWIVLVGGGLSVIGFLSWFRYAKIRTSSIPSYFENQTYILIKDHDIDEKEIFWKM
ncbi:MAG: ABC transporter substrate-binding protein [Promethearchaeota archaeon]